MFNRRDLFKGLFAAVAALAVAPFLKSKTDDHQQTGQAIMQGNWKNLERAPFPKKWGPWDIAANGSMSLAGQCVFNAYSENGGLINRQITYWYWGNNIVETREHDTMSAALKEVAHV